MGDDIRPAGPPGRAGTQAPTLDRRRFLTLAAAGGASVVLSTTGSADPAAAAAGTRVYVLVVDGCRPGEISTGLTPRLAAVRKAGANFPEARAMPITQTLPNHVMMMTGVRPDRSGVPANFIYDRAEKRTRQVARAGDLVFPTLLDRLRSTGRRTGSVLSKEYLHTVFGTRANYRWEPYPLNPITDHASDSTTVDALITMVRRFDPDLVFVNLGDVDRIGHAAIPGLTRDVARATSLINVDRQVGRFIDHLKAAGKWSSSMLVVLADHSMDWSVPDRIVSINGILASRPDLRGSIAMARNGGSNLLYWTGSSSARSAGLAAIRRLVSAHRGILAVHHSSTVRLGPKGGDLVVYCRAGWRFSDSTEAVFVPGNHGHPATEPIPFFIGGGSPKVRRGVSFPDPVRTIDVAPTVGALFRLGAPSGGYDGTARTKALAL